MKFKEVNLYTNQLKELKSFYSQKLGFEIINQTDISFTLRIGWSKLTFNQSNKEHNYHFCFLIPCNQLTPCLDYFKDKIKILNIEGSRQTYNFSTWNADSFYFEDSAGNLGEFIVRHDLENQNNLRKLSNILRKIERTIAKIRACAVVVFEHDLFSNMPGTKRLRGGFGEHVALRKKSNRKIQFKNDH